MRKFRRTTHYAWILWVVSIPASLGPFVLQWVQREPALPQRGIAALSLPRGLAGISSPLNAWDLLVAGSRDDTSMEVPLIPLVAAGTPVAAPVSQPDCRFELSGYVHEGNRQLFCFHDKSSNRWFRLAPGGIDVESQTVLVAGTGDSLPMLFDMLNGKLYQLDSVNHRMHLISSEPASAD